MRVGRMLILAVLIGGCWCYSGETRTPLTLTTSRGTLLGFHSNLGQNLTELYHGEADVFLGIPFAQPPVGDLRFKKPVPMCEYKSANGPYNATQYGNSCPQDGNCAIMGQPISEDCLTLNVFSPDVKSVYKFPVMVFIHGGGLSNGCAFIYHYMGAITNLVSRGVVVVTLQYRVGLFGFFTTGTDDFPANLGMLDQVEGIRWVSDQIQHFGGDPYRITLFGESAGAASVSAHAYSPLSQDLFQQIILESGVALTTFEGSLGDDGLSASRAAQLCKVTDEQWAKKNFTYLVECMKNITWQQAIDLETTNLLGWKMQVDNYFMPDIPHRLAQFRPNIPAIIGSNRDEWSFYDMNLMKSGGLTLDDYNRGMMEFEFSVFATFLGDRQADMLAILENVYAGINTDDEDHLTWLKAECAAFTSAGFTGFIHREYNDLIANQHDRVYLYEMTYSPKLGRILDIPGWDPVWHTAELPYIWLMERPWLEAINASRVSSIDYDLADWFGKTWTDFAKFGQPYPDGGWKPIPLTGRDVYMDISGSAPSMSTLYTPRDQIVWNEMMPALVGDFFPPEKTNGTAKITRERFMRIKEGARFVAKQTCQPVPPDGTTVSPPTVTPSPDGQGSSSTAVSSSEGESSSTLQTTVDSNAAQLTTTSEAASLPFFRIVIALLCLATYKISM